MTAILHDCQLTEGEVRDFFETSKGLVEDEIKKLSEHLNPHLIILALDYKTRGKGVVCNVIATDFNEHEEKMLVMQTIAKEMYTNQLIPLAAVMVCEAWSSKNMEFCEAGGMPKDDPQREEIILSVGTDLGNKYKCASRTALVRKDGRIIVSKLEDLDMDKIEPNLLNSLFYEYAKCAGMYK